jgi:hypothetical protein
MMGNTKQCKKKSTKPGRKRRDSGTVLRSAIEKIVVNESEKIARALVEKTIEGNMTGAKLLVDLTGAVIPRAKPPKKRRGPTLAQRLFREKPWAG